MRSDSRFDLRSDFASQTLVIKDCRVEDSGEYRCEVKNADGVESTTAMLTIQGRFFSIESVNSMWITGTITAKQKVRQKVPGLYAVCR